MKSTAFFVALSVLLFSASILRADILEIGSPEEFAAAMAAADAANTYKLTADLDLSGWTPVDFAATLDGDGHEISGLNSALFTKITGEVKNLTIRGTVCSAKDWPNVAGDYGVLACTNDAATVSRVIVTGANIASTQTARFHIGGIIGRMTGIGGVIEDCQVLNSIIEKNNSHVGGIVGYSDTGVDYAIRRCTVANTTLSGQWVGGILAQSENTVNSGATCIISIEDCFVGGDISGSSYVGGMVGLSGHTKDNESQLSLIRCRNEASVRGTGTQTGAGGMIGFISRGKTSRFEGCVNYGSVSTPANATNAGAGGLVGGIFSGTSSASCIPVVVNCVNYGSVSSGSSMAGGLFGNCSIQLSGAFTNLANHGSVQAGLTYAGGLIGKFGTGVRLVSFANVQNTGAVSASDSDSSAVAGGLVGYEDIAIATMQPFHGAMSIGDVTTAGSAGVLWGSLKNTKASSFSASHLVMAGTATGSQTGLFLGAADSASTVEIVFIPDPETILSSAAADHTYYDKSNTGVDLELGSLGETALSDGTALAVMNAFAETAPDYSVWRQGSDYPYLAFEETVGPVGCAMVELAFKDGEDILLATNVLKGTSQIPYPPDPEKTGYAFLGWEGNVSNLVENTTLSAAWKEGEIHFFTVRFVDWDGSLLQESSVQEGFAAEAPDDPQRENYVFTGWDSSFGEITGDTVVTAQYDLQHYSAGDLATLMTLMNTKRLPAYVITVTADLDFSETTWTPVEFAATIDFDGHAVTGLGVNTSLFSVLSGTVKNLRLVGSQSPDAAPVAVREHFGIVAKELTGGTVSNCSVDGFVIAPAGEICAGMIVGRAYNNAVIENCTVGAGCVITNVAGCSIGGIVGAFSLQNYFGGIGPIVRACTNKANVFVKSGPGNYRGVGGIVGDMSAYSETSKPISKVLACVNHGTLTVGDDTNHPVYVKLGGIVGRAGGTTGATKDAENRIENCINNAPLTIDGKVEIAAGGILGGADRSTYALTGCANYGDVSVRSSVETNRVVSAAGLVGTVGECYPSKDCTAVDCANYGNVSCDVFAGGFTTTVSFNSNHQNQVCSFTNCANYGTISGGVLQGQGFAAAYTDFTGKPGPKALGCFNCYFPLDDIIGYDETTRFTIDEACRFGNAEDFSIPYAVRSLTATAEELGRSSWVWGKSGPELSIFSLPCNLPTVFFLL
ncbi:MAG: InlB B-repeat-containing protein [Kiritimatiellia bacterium]